MKKLLLGLLAIGSISVYAEKKCTLMIDAKSYMKKISNEKILEAAKLLALRTDIKIVTNDAKYSLEVKAHTTLDHHDARYSYTEIDLELWPSNQVQDRSAVDSEYSTGFIKIRKLTKKRLNTLLVKSLKSHLKSCKDLDKKIKQFGNGTITPENNDIYITKTGSSFKRVDSYWKDPSGLMWGNTLKKEYKNAKRNSSAVEACEELGARLPTTQEYTKLLSYFSQGGNRNSVLSRAGQFEFNALFPWSSGLFTTATRGPNGVGYDFFHDTGSSGTALEHWELNVRCVK